jgi:hypothetical protein
LAANQDAIATIDKEIDTLEEAMEANEVAAESAENTYAPKIGVTSDSTKDSPVKASDAKTAEDGAINEHTTDAADNVAKSVKDSEGQITAEVNEVSKDISSLNTAVAKG